MGLVTEQFNSNQSCSQQHQILHRNGAVDIEMNTLLYFTGVVMAHGVVVCIASRDHPRYARDILTMGIVYLFKHTFMENRCCIRQKNPFC